MTLVTTSCSKPLIIDIRLNVPARDVLVADELVLFNDIVKQVLAHTLRLPFPLSFLTSPQPPLRVQPSKRFWIRDLDCGSGMHEGHVVGRVQLKCDGTLRRTGGELKGKLANGLGSQYSSNYLGTWCIQHYNRRCAHLGCQ